MCNLLAWLEPPSSCAYKWPRRGLGKGWRGEVKKKEERNRLWRERELPICCVSRELSKKWGRKSKLAFFGCVVYLVWTFNEREKGLRLTGRVEKRRVKKGVFFFGGDWFFCLVLKKEEKQFFFFGWYSEGDCREARWVFRVWVTLGEERLGCRGHPWLFSSLMCSSDAF